MHLPASELGQAVWELDQPERGRRVRQARASSRKRGNGGRWSVVGGRWSGALLCHVEEASRMLPALKAVLEECSDSVVKQCAVVALHRLAIIPNHFRAELREAGVTPAPRAYNQVRNCTLRKA